LKEQELYRTLDLVKFFSLSTASRAPPNLFTNDKNK